MIYLLTAIGLSPGGRSTVHIYTQTIHRTIQVVKRVKTQYRCAPYNDVSVNDGPRIRRLSHKIII